MNKTTLLSGLLLTVAFGSFASFASDHNDNREFRTGKVGSLISRFESMAQPSAQPVKPTKFMQPTRIAAESKKVFQAPAPVAVPYIQVSNNRANVSQLKNLFEQTSSAASVKVTARPLPPPPAAKAAARPLPAVLVTSAGYAAAISVPAMISEAAPVLNVVTAAATASVEPAQILSAESVASMPAPVEVKTENKLSFSKIASIVAKNHAHNKKAEEVAILPADSTGASQPAEQMQELEESKEKTLSRVFSKTRLAYEEEADANDYESAEEYKSDEEIDLEKARQAQQEYDKAVDELKANISALNDKISSASPEIAGKYISQKQGVEKRLKRLEEEHARTTAAKVPSQAGLSLDGFNPSAFLAKANLNQTTESDDLQEEWND